VGLAAVHPCTLPSLRSGRCALQNVCPDDLSNRWVQIKSTLTINKKPHKGVLLFWRRGWDSNPRRAINPCRFSRPVHSTALPPLRRSVIRRARILTNAALITTVINRSRRPALLPVPVFSGPLKNIISRWYTDETVFSYPSTVFYLTSASWHHNQVFAGHAGHWRHRKRKCNQQSANCLQVSKHRIKINKII
jgi:hypothetical protein